MSPYLAVLQDLRQGLDGTQRTQALEVCVRGVLFA
jgi:hypothetical protein